jgi:hypothetical protein
VIFARLGQRIEPASGEDFLELVQQCIVHQSIRRQRFAAVDFEIDPSKRLTLPPASSTMSAPAAVSQGLRLNSQKPSKRPLATLHKSSAADPARRTP